MLEIRKLILFQNSWDSLIASSIRFSNSGRKAARVKFSVLFLISLEGAELGNRGRRVEGPELPHVFSLLSLPHSLRVCE